MRYLIFFLFMSLANAKVNIIQSLNIGDISFKNVPFSEISGATYNKSSKILYLVSDKGILYRFRATFDNSVHMEKIDAHYIHKKSGKKLKKSKRDTEDVTLDNNGNIYISREWKSGVIKVSKNGQKTKTLKLPKNLKRAVSNLRSENKSLESLTYNSVFGLLTALEYPPKGIKKSKQTIYSLNGKKWNYKSAEVKNSAITAIENIDNNNILVLERAFNGIFRDSAITLQKLNLLTGKQEFVWQLNKRSKLLDNYEALAKVGKNRYIIISDDNDNFFQRTMLIYFEIN